MRKIFYLSLRCMDIPREHQLMYWKMERVVSRLRERLRDPRVRGLAEKYGYLPYMIARYLEILGYDGTLTLLEANEQPLPDSIRCNDYAIDCGELVERLKEKGYVLEKIPWLPHGYRVVEEGVGSIGGTHEYLQGYYYVQDPASMSVVYELEPAPGELIIDMAAAPGGKSTQILQLARDRAVLVAVEKHPRRIRSLRSNLQRLRFSNYVILKGDSTRLSLPTADRILVDAPSTGEGIIRKDPRRKRSRTISDLAFIHELQTTMLEKAIETVAPGGVIVYSACTLAPEEGEMVIDRVLEQHPDILEVEPLKAPTSPGITEYFGVEFDERVRTCGRFWPHVQGVEGFFICKLRVVDR